MTRDCCRGPVADRAMPRRSCCCATARRAVEAWLLTRVHADGLRRRDDACSRAAASTMPTPTCRSPVPATPTSRPRFGCDERDGPRAGRRRGARDVRGDRRAARPCRPPICAGARAPTSRPGAARFGDLLRDARPRRSTPTRCIRGRAGSRRRRGAPLRHPVLRRRRCPTGVEAQDVTTRVLGGGLGRRSRDGARAGAARRARLLPPTMATLASLAGFATVAEAIAAAGAPRRSTPVRRRPCASTDDGRRGRPARRHRRFHRCRDRSEHDRRVTHPAYETPASGDAARRPSVLRRATPAR